MTLHRHTVHKAFTQSVRITATLVLLGLFSSHSHAGAAKVATEIATEFAELFAKKSADDVAQLGKYADEAADLALLRKLNVKPGTYSDELMDIYRKNGTDLPIEEVNNHLRKRTLGLAPLGSIDPQTGLHAPYGDEFQEISYHYLDKNLTERSIGVSDEATPSGTRMLTYKNREVTSECSKRAEWDKIYSMAENLKKRYTNLKEENVTSTMVDIANEILNLIPGKFLMIREDKYLIDIKSPNICGASFKISRKGFEIKLAKKGAGYATIEHNF
ncbi:hypothetical protein KIH87_14120 [Paraneptunicella aestuarii]|uniref:hypothetical protein n=1 Tax=Paraneptunicella aestuarii TaxID=2831148 RepID=UPI001E478DB8|nr:hypothetical protein [Paraneptunicella aestuarii]UAA37829.1 hypothetical protein KIH87_14120 [Paraneptunicella aestuarii]